SVQIILWSRLGRRGQWLGKGAARRVSDLPSTDCCLDCAPGIPGVRDRQRSLLGGRLSLLVRGIVASGLSAALAFSAISFLAWQTADHPVGEPATDPSTVLVHDASGVTEWECFAESSVGSSAANCSGRAESLPATPEFDLPSGGWEAVAGPAVPHGPDASWPAEWPPPAATRLDEEILGSPNGRPTDRPTASPTDRPTHSPAHHPTHRPTHRPTQRPTPPPTHPQPHPHTHHATNHP